MTYLRQEHTCTGTQVQVCEVKEPFPKNGKGETVLFVVFRVAAKFGLENTTCWVNHPCSFIREPKSHKIMVKRANL